jgi:N-acetylglucosamine-6-sulfatase
VRYALVLIATLAVAGCGHEATAARPHRRPNIVFVLTDDLSTDLLRYMPAVQRLQREGTTFDDYVVSDSLCCPSRASIFTGELPHDTGVFTNTPPDGGLYAYVRHADGNRSFAAALRAQGYRTALMGKYLNGYAAADGDVPTGWTDWSATGEGYQERNYTLNQDGRPAFYGRSAADYLTDVIAARGTRFIADAASGHEPFFLELATFAPHQPAVPALRDRRRFGHAIAPRTAAFDRPLTDPPSWLAGRPALSPREMRRLDHEYRRRARSVAAVNDLLERIEAQLRASGQAADTYVVFSSDNGFHMGEHRLLAGKLTAFDSDVRVPLVVAGPGVAPGRRISAVTQNTDLAPTFEQLAGAPISPATDGRSLVPLFAGATPPDWRRWALVEHHHPVRDAGDPDAQTGRSGDPPTYAALTGHRATYVEYVTGDREYYATRAQLHNTYPRLSLSRRLRLHATLARLQDCHGASECATRRRSGTARGRVRTTRR